MTREREPGELVNLSAGGATVTGAHSPAPLVTPTRAATAQSRSPLPVTPSPQASQASPLLSEPLDWGTDAEEDEDDVIAPELQQRSADACHALNWTMLLLLNSNVYVTDAQILTMNHAHKTTLSVVTSS